MQVLLRNVKTGLYLTPSNEWTPERRLAENFHSSPIAVEYAVAQRLRHVEVVYSVDRGDWDLVVPLCYPPEAP